MRERNVRKVTRADQKDHGAEPGRAPREPPDVRGHTDEKRLHGKLDVVPRDG